ncbi:translation initiation protein Sua5 [Rhizodiscina lignyota]|uniref:Threonylcarbamoyl-AMP synthase n=1 Tax=Rhizodiscina lignyota TaxID=1504668 RepID=A0A9P4M936_9PEZI|nr:translation initiation protein Sua5 [Rhizodiscina lignyota]
MTSTTNILPVDPLRVGKFIPSSSQLSSIEDWRLEPSCDSPDYKRLASAAAALRESNIPVAFPTETVYGLGADATRSDAVRGIYKAKQRPSDNPLIVHFASLAQLRSLLRPASDSAELHSNTADDGISPIYAPLIERFWPGPLTILLPLPKQSPLAPEVSAGLHTFGARIPRNALALALIQLADRPIAAPSANASTKPSPTAAEHVKDDLDGRIEIIIDGGPCDVGVESTVVDGLSSPPAILRPGGISLEQLRECPGWENCVIGYKDRAEGDGEDHGIGEGPRAPGMKYRHYSPKAPVILHEFGASMPTVEQLGGSLSEEKRSIGIIRAGTWPSGLGYVNLGDDLEDIARGLFSALRELDRKDVDVIFVEGIDESRGDVAAAIMNRLRKAAEVKVSD